MISPLSQFLIYTVTGGEGETMRRVKGCSVDCFTSFFIPQVFFITFMHYFSFSVFVSCLLTNRQVIIIYHPFLSYIIINSPHYPPPHTPPWK